MNRLSPQPNVQVGDVPKRYSALFWLLVILIGVGAGLGGGLLMKLLHAVQHLSWSYSTGTFLEGVRQGSAARHVLVLLGAGLLAGVGQSVLRGSHGHGGGLAETIWFRKGNFPTLRTLGSAVLSILLVGMGASLGREAALKETGAAIASRLSGWGRLPGSQRRLLAACGAGAGIAAAYNVPLGGALFALEVLLGELALPLVLPALAASFLGAAFSWVLLPDRPTYSIPSYSEPVTAAQLAWAAVAGPLLGLASMIYVRAIAWADALAPSGWRRVLAPVLVFTALGAVAVPFPQLLGNGKDTVQLALTDKFDLLFLLALPALKLLATAGCLGSGAPGGLFTPTLTCGALLGGLLGHASAGMWPGVPPGSCAILGAGAVLAAATQGPLSALVLMIELTWRMDALVAPLLLAVVGATLVARLLEPRSIYSARVRRGESAALAERVSPRTAFDDLLLKDYQVVSAAARYPEVARRLLASGPGRPPLYVVDERGRPIGEITAATVSGRNGLAIPVETATAADLASPVPTILSSADREGVGRQFRESGVTRLPVVEASSRRLVGVVAQREYA